MKTLLNSILSIACVFSTTANAQVDLDGNQQSDIWEIQFRAFDLSPDGDADNDGITNANEAAAGTNPFDPHSRFNVRDATVDGDDVALAFEGAAGKRYDVEYCPVLGNDPWTVIGSVSGANAEQEARINYRQNPGFYRLVVNDQDTDGDGVLDWEEETVGFDPITGNTDRYDQTDRERIEVALGAENTVSLQLAKSNTQEGWPDPALIAVVREGGLDPLTVNLELSGSARAGDDFSPLPASVSFAPGQSIAWILVYPIDDDSAEGDETVTVALTGGDGYTLGSLSSATVTILDAPPNDLPTAEEAARFLAQATFGPNPESIAAVQQMGFEAWIEDQFNQPIGLHQPILESFPWGTELEGPYSAHKMLAWWDRAINAPDPLRQRIAFALSEILVISDRNGELEGQAIGMLHYYDKLLAHSFGNYRELLEDVTYHPCMGIYLSHMGNRPADPEANLFPDENYAREIMQLFSIGLWMLNPDGTAMRDEFGQLIPTYDNDDITNLASVFTGLTWSVSTERNWWNFFYPETELERGEWYLQPMEVWEGVFSRWDQTLQRHVDIYFHDQGPKTVLGVDLPANDPENPDPNYGDADIGRALDVIFNHPNVAPFISRLLIQRMVTSNPSNGYVERVAEAFNGTGPHNPDSVRGDMQSVVRAILLDPEARDAARLDDPEHGLLRENYLRLVALARAFHASSDSGVYPVFWIDDDYGMRPLASPSVFNFFSPNHQPLGAIRDAGLVAPEFEILTAVTGITIPNHLLLSATDRLSWAGEDGDVVRLDLTEAMSLVNDPDALINHLDLLIANGAMSPETYEAIHGMFNHPRFHQADDEFIVESLIYLIAASADAAVLK